MHLLRARLIVSLILGITVVSLCSSGYEVWRTLRRDLQRRAEVLAESLASNVERDIEKGSLRTLQRTVQRFANRERLIGLVVHHPDGQVIPATPSLVPSMNDAPDVIQQALKGDREADVSQKLGKDSVHICTIPLHGPEKFLGVLALVHDAGYMRTQSLRIWRETFLSALAYVILIVLVTLLIVRWSIEGSIARAAHWMRALRKQLEADLDPSAERQAANLRKKRQPGQRSRIHLIVFLATLPDQTHFARLRHDHFVSQLAQHPAHPRRVHPGCPIGFPAVRCARVNVTCVPRCIGESTADSARQYG